MKPLLLSLLLVAGMHAGAALAAGGCDGDMDNAALKQCVHDAYTASDAELNKLFKQIKHRLRDNADSGKLLISAQRSWIAYRDGECDFASSGVEGGSLYPVIATQCRDRLTQRRTKDFKAYLSCPEGDLSCPVPAGE